jgi:hypothetical protein
MSPDEAFVTQILRALAASGLEAIFVGNAAAAIQGAPVTTQDVDLLIRDTPANRKKLEQFCDALGVARPMPVGPLTSTETILGGAWPIDILFDVMSGNLGFASIRSRSRLVRIGDLEAIVASLEDVIASKEAANRPKDVAVLPMLRDALRVMKVLDDT